MIKNRLEHQVFTTVFLASLKEAPFGDPYQHEARALEIVKIYRRNVISQEVNLTEKILEQLKQLIGRPSCFKQKLIEALTKYRELTNTRKFLFYFKDEETFVIAEDGCSGEHILVEVGERFDFTKPIFEVFPIGSDPAVVADKLISQLKISWRHVMSLSADDILKLMEENSDKLYTDKSVLDWFIDCTKKICKEKLFKISLAPVAKYMSQTNRRNWIDKLIKDHGYPDVANALEFDTVEQFKEWYETNCEIDETDMYLLEVCFGEIDT